LKLKLENIIDISAFASQENKKGSLPVKYKLNYLPYAVIDISMGKDEKLILY